VDRRAAATDKPQSTWGETCCIRRTTGVLCRRETACAKSCRRRNTLEKGVDGGQKMRRKQFILVFCCAKSVRATWADTSYKISNWPHGLVTKKEAATVWVELQGIREGNGCSEIFQPCIMTLAWNKLSKLQKLSDKWPLNLRNGYS